MTYATAWADIGIVTCVIVICDFILAIVIGHRLGQVVDRIQGPGTIVIPEELSPDDHIVIWHKDEPPPAEAMPPDPEPDKPRKPIVGLE